MKNFVRQYKITNGRGSIKYITKTSDGEILDSYSTQTEQEWDILFDFNQQQFALQKEKGNWMMNQKNAKGGIAKCIEARMYIVAFPNEMAKYHCKFNGQQIDNDMELAKAIANDWKQTYGTDCYVALHWNKSHTNLHAHILVSERKKKESNEITRAKRNRYYDINGKECKKAEAVRIVKKGDIIGGQNELYESGKLNFKSDAMLERIKEHYSKVLGTELYKNDGLHLPQQHLPRINSRSSDEVLEAYERKKEYNSLIKEHNEIVDTLKANKHEDILNETIKPLVINIKAQKRYRRRYLEDSLNQIRETFKVALMPFKSLLNVFRVNKTKLDNVRTKYNAIDSNVKGYQSNIKLQESVLKTQVKWSDFKQKKYINGLISSYKNQITSLELEKSNLNESKQKLEVKVEKLQKELETRSKGILKRIEHYKYVYGDYPITLNDVVSLEKEEQIKQQQTQTKPTRTTYQPKQPTVTVTALAKSLKANKNKNRSKNKRDLEK